MKIRNIALALLLSGALVSPVVIGGTTGDKDKMADSDTMKGEAPKFEELDANRDGFISEEELNVYGATAAGSSGDMMDKNRHMMEDQDMDGDGKISQQEYEEKTKKSW
ncbi:EF-hand domain-containing protein [Marinobacter caseinilyticus]|uniref:EF-hand domain-containing protein n=1 Tax=Marinobacter caseinilyticus TaxID=2692195 RepID=UPI00140E032E|nr:EF-hand domain-containing protein [Marinobacter caseinilyticus]